MRLTDHVKPIRFLKSDAAKLVIKDVQSCEDAQHTLTLLKILALGQKDIEEGKFDNADKFLAELDDLDPKEQIS
ncbi:prevent-host-death protein [Paraburkholderia phytofirmans]|uniref:prevent-host-death protein n=1 Tax=Paraburkholderia phytofirmans TaxID=261302 RepID=UPI0038B73CAF